VTGSVFTFQLILAYFSSPH